MACDVRRSDVCSKSKSNCTNSVFELHVFIEMCGRKNFDGKKAGISRKRVARQFWIFLGRFGVGFRFSPAGEISIYISLCLWA